ncbi:peroxisomal membrane anchor protein conserved region-domain-containing protein [Nemania sp. FL0916]|nr:peroxisomal membrane anchor protein conserved region-domain-containing protein [Nemania sp. FL0916]
MGDSEKPMVPAWQAAHVDVDANAESQNAILEQARQFLNDAAVKAASPEDIRDFLKSKGIDDSQIDRLLEEVREDGPTPAPESAPDSSPDPAPETGTPDEEDNKTVTHHDTSEAPSSLSIESPPLAASSTPQSSPPATSSVADSPPPIITYPEFLTKPQRPPPLITPSRLANILAVSGGVWALLYGISGLVVRPMVDNLNEARSEYYSHVNGKMSQLVDKLEGAVSEVPYNNGRLLKSQHYDRAMDDNASTTSDPTELFHRDVGTQTSPPPSLLGTASDAGKQGEKAVDIQARRLSAISSALRELTLTHTQQAESKADLRSTIGEIRDEVDKLTHPPVHDFSTYGGLNYGQSAEPDDEFKKTKDAIRSVKGLFLSSRSFPSVTTR